ncbi:MAG: prepilin-type N-terminal cleavage/methylation domain-containing protein [Phycisphaerales bacterium]
MGVRSVHHIADRRGSGFTLVELLIVIFIITLLIGLLAPALGRVRSIARDVACKSNLRQLGAAAANYSANSPGAEIPSFWWQPGTSRSTYLDVDFSMNRPGADSLDAAQAQETDILRRRTGRDTGQTPQKIKLNTLRYPHRRFTHLVLLDQMDVPFPDPRAACPEDEQLIRWSRDPMDLSSVPTVGDEDSTTESRIEIRQRWAYSSTYQAVPASWSPDTRQGTRLTVGPVERFYNLFTRIDPALRLGGRRMDEVAFPGAKVFFFEFHDRHSAGRPAFYAYPQAKGNQLFFDASVRAEKTANSNPGFDPNDPSGVAPAVVYDPAPGAADPPPLHNPLGDTLKGHYRWTRGGLRGVDYAGDDIDTGRTP